MPPSESLPDFIVIGAMNCGTTSLHRYLGLHPDIGMSTPKETDFFLASTSHDVSWYKECFPKDARIRGESSPNYSKYPTKPGVPERIHALLPNVQLIYLVRDPIARIVSHYLHSLDRRREHRSIDAVLSGDLSKNHYVLCSSYHLQLMRYLKFYSEDQILVVASERLRHNRRKVLQNIFRFLGVNPTFNAEALSVEHGTSSEKTQDTWLGRLISGTKIATWIRRLIPSTLETRARSLLHRPATAPKLSTPLRMRLHSALEDDVRNLRSLTGDAFEEWSL